IMVNLETSQYVIVSNCYAHGWTHSGATSDVLVVVYADVASPYNPGSRMTGCVIDGANSGGTGVADSGGATYALQNADNNIIRNLTNGLIVGYNSTVHDNLIGPINTSFDAGMHENCIEPIGMGTNYFYNNVWHDCTAVGILTQGGAPSSVAEIDYLWNNVAYVGTTTGPPIPFQFDSTSTNMAGSAVYAYNNTIYGGSSVCMRTTDRGNGNYGTLDVRNNHCINTSGGGTAACGSGGNLITLQITGTSCTIANNKIDGATTNFAAPPSGSSFPPPYAYSPANGSADTISYGQNLSSLATGSLATLANDTAYGAFRAAIARPATWDAGAYEYSTTALPGSIMTGNTIHTSGTVMQ